MPASTPELMIQAATILVSVVTGGAMGAVITWAVTERRERKQRRRSFIRHLHYFRGRLERVYWQDEKAVWRKYEELAPEFKGEAALVASDFPNHTKFHSLADRVGGWPKHEVENRAKEKGSTVYQVLLDSIDELIKFTNTH